MAIEERNAKFSALFSDGASRQNREQLGAGSAYREYILAPHGAMPQKKAQRAASDTSRPRKRGKR
jgi:hypothetical protein